LIKLADTKSGGPQLVTMNAPARQVLKALEAGKRQLGMGPAVGVEPEAADFEGWH
jgi:hypothetical protein